MGTRKKFSAAEQELLRANPYTEKVTEHQISFTLAFKEAFWLLSVEGCTGNMALRNGLFVLFRTVSYTDVHRGLGHGLGQNAFPKIWSNFLTAKCKKKLRNQAISELFMASCTN